MEESLVRYSKLSIITATNRFNICREEAIMQLERGGEGKGREREGKKSWKGSRYDSLSRVCGLSKKQRHPRE